MFEGYGWYYWDSSSSGNYSPNNYNWYYSAVMPMGTGTGIAVGKVTVGFDANGGSSSATSGEYISGSLIGACQQLYVQDMCLMDGTHLQTGKPDNRKYRSAFFGSNLLCPLDACPVHHPL